MNPLVSFPPVVSPISPKARSPNEAAHRASPPPMPITSSPLWPPQQLSSGGGAFGNSLMRSASMPAQPMLAVRQRSALSAVGSVGAPAGLTAPPRSSRSGYRQRPRGNEPSRAFGNPSSIVLPTEGAGESGAAGDANNLPTQAFQLKEQLDALDRSSRLAHWMNAFAADEEAFASKAVFVEMRLRQALSSSVHLGVPNTFRIAVVCDAFERVAPMTGRCEREPLGGSQMHARARLPSFACG